MKPFFPYFGSKWNLARRYQNPRFDTVVEPFAGSAGYSTFYGVRKAKLSDADPIIVGVWSYLMRVTATEILALPELANIGDNVDDYKIPQESKWLIGFWLNRGSAQPKKARTAYSARVDKRQLNWGLRAKERIASQLDQIKDWSISLQPYHHVKKEEATWFVDPPYVDKGRYYRVPFHDYEGLGSWCKSLPGQVIVCEGPGALWLPFERLGLFKSTKGKAEEWVFIK